MTDLFSMLGQLAGWFASWVPRLQIIKENSKMVKYVRGWDVKVVDAGLAVYWPLVTEVAVHFVGRCVMNLTNQTLTTKDGRTVVVSGVVAYSIDDVVKYEVNNWSTEHAIDDVALAAIKHVIVRSTYEDLLSGQRRLDGRLTREARRSLADFGVDVEYVRLTDFAPARAISLSGVNTGT